MAKTKKKTVRKAIKKASVGKKQSVVNGRLSIMLMILAILVFVLAAMSMS